VSYYKKCQANLILPCIGTIKLAAKWILNKPQIEFIDCLKSDSSYRELLGVVKQDLGLVEI
jgi:hypothetical protein